ncbi:O-antigen ligase family protein [Nocardioides carbamazepini]|uniref:O-antigen ligase family protein n=1 Tax=Nocardioides carbamazepini TaxID=2854259 RepID=UPI002149A0EB|nr:O-antigen ligase family protein [Nocardioides carbamazepini]MCR1782003.1 O-antigen ligase family protein [Nocardioides carbamazepini]
MTVIVSRAAPEVGPSPARPRATGRSVRALLPNLLPSLPAGAGWLALGAVASKASQTLVLLLVAAVLDPAALGVVALGAALLNVTTVLADLGTATALVHFRGDAERAARSAVTLALVTSLGLVTVVWVAAPWLAGLLRVGAPGAEVFRGVVLCVPLAAVGGISAELLRRRLDFRRRILPDVVGSAVGAAVTGVALAAGAGAFALVPGQLAQAVVALALLWTLRPPVRPGWSARDAATLLSYGSGLAGGALLSLVMLNVDYALVAHRLGADDLGAYSMAFRIAFMPYLLVAVVIGGAVFPQLCRLRGAAVGESAVAATVVVQRLLVPVYTAMVVLAPLLRLLGDEWAVAVPALRWLAAYGLVLSVLEPLLVALRAVGRTADTLGLAALHVVLLVLLLGRYVERGITAVAVTQLAAALVTLAAAAVLVTVRVPGFRWSDLARRTVPLMPARAVADALSRSPGRPRRLVATVLAPAVLVVLAVGAGLVAARAPYVALAVVAGLAALAAAVLRVEWAAIALVVAAPFAHLLQEEIHPAAFKAAGAVLFVSWSVRVLHDPRPRGLRRPGLVALGALVVVLVASFVANGADVVAGGDHVVSYAAHALVVVVLVDLLRRSRPGPTAFARRLATAYVLSCTAAGAVGLVSFLVHGGRAAGPLADPNDLAFFLITALPFAVLHDRRSTAATWGNGCGAVLLVATLATFSRGALVGLLAMVVVALLLRAVRPVTLLGVGALAAVCAIVVGVTHGDVVARGLAEKEHVAAGNVAQRLTAATVAVDMTAANPVLGQGPGGFAAERTRFLPAGGTGVRETVAHQMYLDVSAELGLAGLAAFLAVLVLAARGALRARRTGQGRRTGEDRRTGQDRSLADAVLVALAGAATAACFLSEQYFLPIWLLAALGLGIEPLRTRLSAPWGERR